MRSLTVKGGIEVVDGVAEQLPYQDHDRQVLVIGKGRKKNAVFMVNLDGCKSVFNR